MLPSQYLQNRRLPSAIGADEEAAVAGAEREGKIVDEGSGSGRRLAVDAWIGESEVGDFGGGVWIMDLDLVFFCHLSSFCRAGDEDGGGGRFSEELGGLTRTRLGGESWESRSALASMRPGIVSTSQKEERERATIAPKKKKNARSVSLSLTPNWGSF